MGNGFWFVEPAILDKDDQRIAPASRHCNASKMHADLQLFNSVNQDMRTVIWGSSLVVSSQYPDWRSGSEGTVRLYSR